MPKPTKRQIEREVQTSVELFERAKRKAPESLEPRRPGRVLLAIDGSEQDATAVMLAENLHQRLGAEIAVVDARERDDIGPGKRKRRDPEVQEDENDLSWRVADALGGTATPPGEGSSFERILEAVDSTESQLLVMPCPYGRDLDAVGPDSAGTVIDVLLARSPVPVLVIRKPFAEPEKLFSRMRLILSTENEAAADAACWAVGMIAPGGSLSLVLVVEKEFRENVRALLESIAPDVDVGAESLSMALARAYQPLHRALQQAAGKGNFAYRLEVREEHIEPAIDAEERPRPLILLALERSDSSSQGNVQNRIRLSPHPVLVVPT